MVHLRWLLAGLVGLVSLGSLSGVAAAVGCPNEAARVGLAQTLPDCRAYELVSPGSSAAGDVRFAEASSGDGDHAWFSGGLGAVYDGQGAGWPTAVAAQRDAAGWRDEPLAASADLFSMLVGASEDGTQSLILTGRLLNLSSIAGNISFDAVDASGNRKVVLVTHRPNTPYPEPLYLGSSNDLSRVFVLDSVSPLLSEQQISEATQLYEGHNGQVQLVGVDENGQPSSCGSNLAGGRRQERGRGQNGLSADGKTVFYTFQLAENGGCSSASDLYVRREGHSTDISAPSNGSPDLGATYLGNDRSGSVVYFMTASQLVSEDTDSEVDIYKYEVGSGRLEPITRGAGVVSAAVSLDGLHVYFVAHNPIDGHGTAGMDNLFVWTSDGVSYIATGSAGSTVLGGSGWGEENASQPQSPVTPDGRVLLFFSTASLTGYDNTDAVTGLPDDELFRYVASNGELLCVSCNPSGAQPIGGYKYLGGVTQAFPEFNAFFRDYVTPSIGNRYMSDDGEFVFFTSQDDLVPQDTNGVRDVYEWHAGTLSLLSGGGDEQIRGNGFGATTELVGASASGRDVFFISPARLNAEADHGYVKLWDARVDGGFAPPPAASSCEGEGCRAFGGETPVFSAPASSMFIGAGNASSSTAASAPKTPSTAGKRRAHPKAKKNKHRRQSGRRSRRANKSTKGGRR